MMSEIGLSIYASDNNLPISEDASSAAENFAREHGIDDHLTIEGLTKVEQFKKEFFTEFRGLVSVNAESFNNVASAIIPDITPATISPASTTLATDPTTKP